jgi:Ser/Thr protein kinase RdoA (MazF antagonist)
MIPNEADLKRLVANSLGKTATEFRFFSRGAVNNVYYLETTDGDKCLVKVEREDKEFQPQNNLSVEAAVANQLSTMNLSIPTPTVRFVTADPAMYGYDYIEGTTLRSVWPELSEEYRVEICKKIGLFHGELAKNFTKETAVSVGIRIDDSRGLHPEVQQEYEQCRVDESLPQQWCVLLDQAKTLFDQTDEDCVFKFVHNDGHHENVLINNNRISGFIDFGNAEFGEVAKEFSRYIRDYPDYFQYIVEAYEVKTGLDLSRKRLISNAFVSGFAEFVEAYQAGGDKRSIAEQAVVTYQKLLKPYLATSMPITFVAGLHGNERLPVQALIDSGIDFILGNPLAYERNVRFVDEDLNASFKKTGDSYEVRRAAEILNTIPADSLVIDFHTTTATTEPFVILADPAMEDFARSLGISNIVLMKHSIKEGHALINHAPGVSVELGKHDDVSAGYDLVMSIVKNVGEMPRVEHNLFEVYDVLREDGEYKNFIEHADGFVPILYGEEAYRNSGIFGLKARRVQSFGSEGAIL